MSNLSSIYHLNFDRLHDLTNSYNKATFLDKLIYWWQISKYTLNDEKIWFTRSISQIAKDAKISERTVSRYLNEFEQLGLIKRINKLFIKKHLYIHITDKLLTILSINNQNKPQVLDKQKGIESPERSLNLEQNGTNDLATMAVSIYKDQDNNVLVNNNTVNHSFSVNNLKNISNNEIQSIYPIEKIIGERLSLREKNYIKGMMNNLQKQNGLSFSSPEQLFAEIVFTVLNEEQLQGIGNFNHQIQIIAKLLRQKVWKTPKGFYNHADFGAFFKNENTKYQTPNRQGFYSSATTSDQELKQKVAHHKSQFDEIDRIINSDTEALKDRQINLAKHPNLLMSVNSITKSLINHYEEQIGILNNIQQLNKLKQINSFIPEHQIKQEEVIQNTLLRLLEEKINYLAQCTFEVFCDMSNVNFNRETTDITYILYEQLMKLLKDVEKLVLLNEDYFDYEYAA